MQQTPKARHNAPLSTLFYVGLLSESNSLAEPIRGLNGAKWGLMEFQAPENTTYPSVTTREHQRPRPLPLCLPFTTLEYSEYLEYSGHKTHVTETYSLLAVPAPPGAQ